MVMTETAKQDTTKAPAESAATESAATQGEAVPEASGPETTDEAADATAEETVKPDLDETKRKFREALERKHQVHNEGQGNGARDGGKVSGAHGPAASRRSFRRKSG
jgi:Family of unknown function (DUF5302)